MLTRVYFAALNIVRRSVSRNTNFSNDEMFRKSEVNALRMTALFTALQTVTFGIVSYYAINQWSTDKFISLDERWNSDEMKILRNRVNDAVACTTLETIEFGKAATDSPKPRHVIFDLPFSDKSTKNSKPINLTYAQILKISAIPRENYAGLDETMLAMLDFADEASKCKATESCAQVCKHYGQTFINYDTIFQQRYAHYQIMYGNSGWGRGIEKFVDECQRILGSESNLKVNNGSQNKLNIIGQIDTNTARAWKERACTRMSKTAAEEIANAK
jgi:hypothetical protein